MKGKHTKELDDLKRSAKDDHVLRTHHRHVLGNPVVRRDLLSLEESDMDENNQVTYVPIPSARAWAHLNSVNTKTCCTR